jgi:ABC-type branched-subunit amino acid transport system substrate-binding protein
MKKAIVIILALMVATATIATNPQRASGAYKGTIVIPACVCLTGIYAAVTEHLWRGTQLCVKYTNEKGGLEGYEIKLEWADSGYIAARTLSIYKRFRALTPKPSVILLYGSPDGEALKKELATDRIVGFNYGQSDAQVYPPAYNVIWGFPYAEAYVRYLEWLAESRAKKEPVKVGFLGYEAGWVLAHREMMEKVAPSLGMKVGSFEVVPPVPVDLTTQMVKFRDTGVNEIYVILPPPGYSVALRNYNELGLKAKGINITAFWWSGIDNQIIALKDKAEGARLLHSWFSEADGEKFPGVKTATDYWYHFYSEKPQMTFYCGWMGMEVIGEAIRLALKEVGGDASKLTGDLVIKGLESIKDWQGLVHPKYSGKPGLRTTSPHLRISEVQGGKSIAITDFFYIRPLPRDISTGKIFWDQYKPPK